MRLKQWRGRKLGHSRWKRGKEHSSLRNVEVGSWKGHSAECMELKALSRGALPGSDNRVSVSENSTGRGPQGRRNIGSTSVGVAKLFSWSTPYLRTQVLAAASEVTDHQFEIAGDRWFFRLSGTVKSHSPWKENREDTEGARNCRSLSFI